MYVHDLIFDEGFTLAGERIFLLFKWKGLHTLVMDVKLFFEAPQEHS